jgi:uncharacterized membrane protein
MADSGGRRPAVYAITDSAQQVVGGFLLAGPFVVTEEVWLLANNMTVAHSLVTVAIVFAIGYGALYKADDDRDPDRESEVIGIPIRFISLMFVSYGSVTVLAFAVTAPDTFAEVVGGISDPVDKAIFTAKAVGVGAIFSVVGAATADSVF